MSRTDTKGDMLVGAEYAQYAEALAARINITQVVTSPALRPLKPITMQDFQNVVSLVMPSADVAGIAFDEVATFAEFLVFEWGYQVRELGLLIRSTISSLINPNDRMKSAIAEIGHPSAYEAILALGGLEATILKLDEVSAIFQSDLAAVLQNHYALHVVQVVLARRK